MADSTFYQQELTRKVEKDGEIVRWMLLLGVSIAALLEVIDSSITNVALPHIQGNLGATASEAAWVVTAYAVANVITMPLAVMLGNIFGKKPYFILSVIGFTIASVLCGISPNLTTLVLNRVLQGLFGGGLLAKAQAILFESFPPEKQGIVQGIFGICVLVGPVVGPTLGGWLTDNFDWRWIFFINVPVGIISTILCSIFLPRDASLKRTKVSVDWSGILTLSIFLGCLQYVLEKGQDDDWFSSRTIVACSIASVIGCILFLWHELRVPNPAVDLRVMRYRAVSIGLAFQALIGFVMYGVNYVLPNFAQIMLGYTALQAGMLQVPGAIVSGILFPIVGAVSSKFDARFLVALGLFIMGISNLSLSYLTLQWGWNDFQTSTLLRGVGIVLVYLPLMLAALGDCPPDDVQTASSLLSLTRNMGGSIGIAVLATLLTRRADFHRAVLAEKVTPYGLETANRLSQLTQMFQHNGWSFLDAKQHALGVMWNQLNIQAYGLSYADIGWIVAVCTLGSLPFCLSLSAGKRQAPVELH
jgi:DHA2 family multidrug resistance protein